MNFRLLVFFSFILVQSEILAHGIEEGSISFASFSVQVDELNSNSDYRNVKIPDTELVDIMVHGRHMLHLKQRFRISIRSEFGESADGDSLVFGVKDQTLFAFFERDIASEHFETSIEIGKVLAGGWVEIDSVNPVSARIDRVSESRGFGCTGSKTEYDWASLRFPQVRIRPSTSGPTLLADRRCREGTSARSKRGSKSSWYFTSPSIEAVSLDKNAKKFETTSGTPISFIVTSQFPMLNNLSQSMEVEFDSAGVFGDPSRYGYYELENRDGKIVAHFFADLPEHPEKGQPIGSISDSGQVIFDAPFAPVSHFQQYGGNWRNRGAYERIYLNIESLYKVQD